MKKKLVKYEKHVLGIVKVNGIVKFIENETNQSEKKNETCRTET